MQATIPDNWYETFFTGINCEMWEKAGTKEWTDIEVSFLKDVLQLCEGSSLLDIPCGTGRHAIEFAKENFRVTAVDISDDFINGLNKKIAEQNLNITVMHKDILSVQIDVAFDGAYTLGNSFGYFTYDGMETFVSKVAACLKLGARWIINSGLMAESFLAKFMKEKTYELPGMTMQINNEYDIWNSCLLTTLTYIKEGQQQVHRFKHHVYTVAEVIRLLQKFNLKTMALYNSTDKTPYSLGDAQVYLVAEKI